MMTYINKADLVYFYLFIPVVFLLYLFSNSGAYALQGGIVTITDLGSFTDPMGIKNIVGTVQNNNNLPIQMLIGLNITNSNNTISHLVAEPYGKIIYPYREAPFKLKISSPNVKPIGKPFVYEEREVNVPYYDVIRLNYSNVPMQNGSLIGSVKNIASFDIHGLTIYASAHDQTGEQ